MSGDVSQIELLDPVDAEERQRRAAGALAAAGCRPGDRVAFSLGSSADLLCAVLGATRSGLVPVLLNATLLPGERGRLLADCRPARTFLTGADLAPLADGAAAELAPRPLTRPLHYTSGTTGRPKGVYAGLWDDATAAAAFDDEADLWQFGPGDVHLVCSPMYHSVSVRLAAGTLLRGGRLAILRRFDATTALSALRRLRPTTTFMAPAHLQRLLTLPGLGPDERFGSLRLLVHAGAPCPPALKRAALARVDPGVLWEFYGSTEGQFTVCSPEEWLARPGTVGRARPGRSLAIAPAPEVPQEPEAPEAPSGPGTPAPRGPGTPAATAPAVGTIWCSAPRFARFVYWDDDEATAAAWRGADFTVGDLGYLDPDGYLFFAGRRHDLIISGGVNVYPAEVEAALLEIPGVAEAAVFGRPDERWGEQVCAAVVLGRGVDERTLRSAASARLAPYKCPKEYFEVLELPHTATGKLLRRGVPAQLGLEG